VPKLTQMPFLIPRASLRLFATCQKYTPRHVAFEYNVDFECFPQVSFSDAIRKHGHNPCYPYTRLPKHS